MGGDESANERMEMPSGKEEPVWDCSKSQGVLHCVTVETREGGVGACRDFFFPFLFIFQTSLLLSYLSGGRVKQKNNKNK